MEGKNNYNNPKVKKEIKILKEAFKLEKVNPIKETNIVYSFDRDNDTVDSKSADFLTKIKMYCEKNSYDLILHNTDIEEAFQGVCISKKLKTKETLKFYNYYKKINFKLPVTIIKRLSCENTTNKKKSNVILVLGRCK